jgi:hypothetical protein
MERFVTPVRPQPSPKHSGSHHSPSPSAHYQPPQHQPEPQHQHEPQDQHQGQQQLRASTTLTDAHVQSMANQFTPKRLSTLQSKTTTMSEAVAVANSLLWETDEPCGEYTPTKARENTVRKVRQLHLPRSPETTETPDGYSIDL